MGHLGAFARCARSEIVAVNHGTFETPTSRVKNDACSIGTTPDNKDVELLLRVLQLLQVLFTRLHLKLVLGALVFAEPI